MRDKVGKPSEEQPYSRELSPEEIQLVTGGIASAQFVSVKIGSSLVVSAKIAST